MKWIGMKGSGMRLETWDKKGSLGVTWEQEGGGVFQWYPDEKHAEFNKGGDLSVHLPVTDSNEMLGWRNKTSPDSSHFLSSRLQRFAFTETDSRFGIGILQDAHEVYREQSFKWEIDGVFWHAPACKHTRAHSSASSSGAAADSRPALKMKPTIVIQKSTPPTETPRSACNWERKRPLDARWVELFCCWESFSFSIWRGGGWCNSASIFLNHLTPCDSSSFLTHSIFYSADATETQETTLDRYFSLFGSFHFILSTSEMSKLQIWFQLFIQSYW